MRGNCHSEGKYEEMDMQRYVQHKVLAPHRVPGLGLGGGLAGFEAKLLAGLEMEDDVGIGEAQAAFSWKILSPHH